MKKKSLLLILWALMLPAALSAQYTIYPVPQEQVAGTGKVSFTPNVCIVSESGIDAVTRSRAEQILKEHGLTPTFADTPSQTLTNIYLGLNSSGEAADLQATTLGLSRNVFSESNKFDRHLIALTDGGSGTASLVVLGESTNATFYGLASLEQMLDGGTTDLPTVTIADYADQQNRGIVEGYYGYPYSVSVKKDLMRYMMRYKMNTYLYGAKSDPYHSNNWRDPYPTTITAEQEKQGWLSQDMVKDISETSQQTKVNFIWAIHPGNNFVGSSTVIDEIMSKFEKMHDLGVRQFGVFVDDVSIPSSTTDMETNANRLTGLQEAIDKKWNGAGALPTDTVRPLHFVPQIYCTSFAGGYNEKFQNFFNALSTTPSKITIYTTGWGVWSTPNSSDFDLPAKHLGRSVAWWWNYPCNDNADRQIYPMDMYSNFYDMPSVNDNATMPASLSGHTGIVSNPMQQGEVAKTALFSVADYAWNTSGFDNQASWEASFKAVLPGNTEAQKAYRFLAPYLRWNDPEELGTMINAYKQNGSKANELTALMDEIQQNCKVMFTLENSEVAGEKLLYTDLAPFLRKLHDLASVVQSLIMTSAIDNLVVENAWPGYIKAVRTILAFGTSEDYQVSALEGMGGSISSVDYFVQPAQRSLAPFAEYLKDNTINFEKEATPTKPQFITNAEGVSGTASGTTTVYPMTSKPMTLKKGEWMGLQLVNPTLIQKITVNDTLIANHTVVYSPDGKQWKQMTESTLEPTDYVRYVGVVNDRDEAASIRLYATSIRVTMPTPTVVSTATAPSGAVYWQDHNESYMKDGDYTTFTCLNRNQQNGDTYTLKLSKKQTIKRVRIGMGTTNGDYMTAGKVQTSADGIRWSDLPIFGTSTTNYTLSNPNNVVLSDEVTICDFDGQDREAQYVRLMLSTANTSRWLRLYEIEVNGEGSFNRQICENNAGKGYVQVADADASTSTAGAQKVGQKGILTYYFQDYALLNGVTLFTDSETMEGVVIETTTDLENWSEVSPTGEGGILKLSFAADAAQPTALRFTWTGSTAPAIYEIIEQVDANRQPIVTKIEQVSSSASTMAPIVSLEGGRLMARSAVGLSSISVYNLDGRQLVGQQLTGQQEAHIPLLRNDGEPLLVKVVLTNGQQQTYKVM